MLISIVVPVYNVEKYLEQCVMSFINQIDDKRNDIEIILIDDGSLDKSGFMCDEFTKRYPNVVKTFHKKNEGLLMTRRFGYKVASGEYIINCDSDDFVEPNLLQNLIPLLDGRNDVIIYNMFKYQDGKKTYYTNEVFGKQKQKNVSNLECIKELFLSYNVTSLCCKAFKRSCLELEKDYLAFSTLNFGEDTLQSVEVFSNSQNIVYCNKCLYNYRVQNGMTYNFKDDYYWQFKQVLLEVKKNSILSKIDDFEYLYSVKLWEIVARAITQSRYNPDYSKEKSIQYLKKIRNDAEVKKYVPNFQKIYKNLKRQYVVLLTLFIKRKYRVLWILLLIRNKIGK